MVDCERPEYPGDVPVAAGDLNWCVSVQEHFQNCRIWKRGLAMTRSQRQQQTVAMLFPPRPHCVRPASAHAAGRRRQSNRASSGRRALGCRHCRFPQNPQPQNRNEPHEAIARRIRIDGIGLQHLRPATFCEFGCFDNHAPRHALSAQPPHDKKAHD